MPFELTTHAKEMLKERGIIESWIEETLTQPSRTELKDDNTVHFLKPVAEWGGRTLRVVVTRGSNPPRVITAFFDRRAKGGI
ncbi:MAG: DUF4258 domain-containing protein [Chloroflexi bacterium]|nr:DUF4258 domain-containing protein [Chloroflexota bacterium]